MTVHINGDMDPVFIEIGVNEITFAMAIIGVIPGSFKGSILILGRYVNAGSYFLLICQKKKW